MNSISYELKKDCLTAALCGRVDSANAKEVEEQLETIRRDNPHEELVLDLEKLEYISSAGLRIFLRARKTEKNMRAINVSTEVYEVFSLTGFAEIIPVEKAFRRLTEENWDVIGKGANGTVCRISPDTIIKIYHNPDSLPDIRRERELARKAFVLGVPTAIPYDIVRVGEGYGSVFELLDAKSLAALIRDDPENLDAYTAIYVDLLKKIHATPVKPEDMPDEKAVFLDWARRIQPYFPEEKGKKLVSLVEAVPERHQMIHGDYHIKNVMVQDGEALLIDMDTLCWGNPVFELASMFNAYCGFGALDPRITSDFLGIPLGMGPEIWKKSLALYLGTRDEILLGQVEDKAKLLGYTRLMKREIKFTGPDRLMESEKARFYAKEISDLLDKTEALAI